MPGVSAPSGLFDIEQPDGTKIPVRMFGHEYYNWIETEDVYVIQWVSTEEDEGWYYAKLNEGGKFIPSTILVSYPAPRDIQINRKIRESSPKVRKLNYHQMCSTSNQTNHLYRKSIGNSLKPLVFLVDFNDQAHEYTRTNFFHLFFSENLSSNTPGFLSDHTDYTMSVKDYFHEISYGKQLIEGDLASITNWKTAENEYSHYVDNAQGTGEGPNGISNSAASLVVEIAMALNDEGFDFSQFDNGHGAIDVVILVVAGKGGPSSNHFWPHMFVVPDVDNGLHLINPNATTNGDDFFALDGVAIRKYIVIQEKYAWNHDGTGIDMIHPIGTICHELGHVLGLPDLYDTSENSASGIGEWGLMGSGNYLRQTSPAYMSAWSRYRLGYITPIVLSDVIENHTSILSAEENQEANAYILPLDSNIPQEYLILENRQQVKSDRWLPESGLLVWHIDETITDMYPGLNSVNVNSNFYGVNLLQADGNGKLYTNCNIPNCADSGDPFKTNGLLTGSTNPNTDTYSYDRDADGIEEEGGDSSIEIKDIQEQDGVINMIINNRNVEGNILSYDEGNYEAIAFPKIENVLEWVGIRVPSRSTSLLSGIEIVFPPTFSNVSNVTDYIINIWEGWDSNEPQRLFFTYPGEVQWSESGLRDGGWAHISLIDENIIFKGGLEYYIEINYNGIVPVSANNPNGYNYAYFFDQGINTNNISHDMSYYRSDSQETWHLLSDLSNSVNGDWNIRAVFSGQNCGTIVNREIWPGDSDENGVVDALDIEAIINNFGDQGCFRTGESYLWESMDFPDGWDNENDALADTNGDGIVDIADVLVILVNWNKTHSITNRSLASNRNNILFQDFTEQQRENALLIYETLKGSSEPEIEIRQLLEDVFGFSMNPENYLLGENFPNPFNSYTIIPYFLSQSSHVEINIYDLRGRLVDQFKNYNKNKGWYEYNVNTDRLVSGIYFYQLKIQNEIISYKKMILLK